MTFAKRGPKSDPIQSVSAAKRIRDRRIELGISMEEMISLLSVSMVNYKSFEESFGNTRQRKYGDKIAYILKTSPKWIEIGQGLDDPYQPDPKALFGETITKAVRIQPKELRIRLGARLTERRKELGYPASHIAKEINLSNYGYRLYESCLPRHSDARTETIIENLLFVPSGWLRNLHIDTPPHVIENKVPELHCKTIAEEIRLIGTWLCRETLLKRTIDYENLTNDEKRTVDIFTIRHGVKGESEIILNVIGQSYGITRERIRQIVQKMMDRADGLKVNPKQILYLTDAIKEHLPCKPSLLDEKFKDLLGENLSIVGADRFAREILGIKIIDITEQPADMSIAWDAIAYDPSNHNPEFYKATRNAAHKMIRCCGAAQLSYITGEVSDILNIAVSKAEILKSAKLTPGFEWLSEANGWFWFGDKGPVENKVLSIAKKILTISSKQIDVEDIAQGLSRSRRDSSDESRNSANTIETPTNIIVEILARTPWIQCVQFDDFKLKEPIDAETVLSETEFKAFQFLSDAGGFASKYELTNRLVKIDNINPITMALMLNQSPIISRLDVGIYALRGWPLNMGSLEKAVATVFNNSNGYLRNLDESQAKISEDGWIHFMYTVNENQIKRGYFDIPQNIASHLMNGQQFKVDGFDTPVTYVLHPERKCYRLNMMISKIIKSGFQFNETINVHINIKTNKIRLTKHENQTH